MFFKKELNQKGQSGAPFELLVAVIIMAFVIIIGAQVINSTNEKVCENNVHKSVLEFKGFLEDTVNRKSVNKFIFYPDDPCFEVSKAVTKIEKLFDEKSCLANCGQPLSSCWVISFNSVEERTKSIYYRTCVNLPVYTTFLGTSGDCFEEGFVAVNVLEKIPFGQYTLKYYAEEDDTSSVPKICVMHKYAG